MELVTTLESWLAAGVGFVWGWPSKAPFLVILCLGGGLYFTLRYGFVQFRAFRHAIDVVRGKFDHDSDEGDISHLQALSTAVSGTVGLGNIAGVAIAIKTGGPGAVFWMWMIGLLGMATKFTECTLATHYRHKMSDGEVRGGPMYYILDGLGKSWKWLASFFAFACAIAAFGGGNMFQSNQVAQILHDNFGVENWLSGLVFASLVGTVIIGGIKRIGHVAGVLVPAMCSVYVMGALLICVMNIAELGEVFAMVVRDAFSLKPMIGGSFGAMIMIGVQRAVFSSESGFGTAPIAHAAAKSDYGVRQGVVSLLEPFIDTVVVCSATAFVILLSGVYTSGEANGVTLTVNAFDTFFSGFGTYFVTTAVVLFAFSTAISWSYYGIVGANYAGGERTTTPYRWLYIGALFIGAVWSLTPLLHFMDLSLAMMLIPNMLVCLALSGKVAKLSKEYFAKLKEGEMHRSDVANS